MDEATIRSALGALSDELGRRKVQGELCLLGGTTMVLAFHARQSTKDVDAIFQPASAIRAAAEAVRESLQLPDDWLNDAAKGFVSSVTRFELTICRNWNTYGSSRLSPSIFSP